jgi:hypothetical protein
LLTLNTGCTFQLESTNGKGQYKMKSTTNHRLIT